MCRYSKGFYTCERKVVQKCKTGTLRFKKKPKEGSFRFQKTPFLYKALVNYNADDQYKKENKFFINSS